MNVMRGRDSCRQEALAGAGGLALISTRPPRCCLVGIHRESSGARPQSSGTSEWTQLACKGYQSNTPEQPLTVATCARSADVSLRTLPPPHLPSSPTNPRHDYHPHPLTPSRPSPHHRALSPHPPHPPHPHLPHLTSPPRPPLSPCMPRTALPTWTARCVYCTCRWRTTWTCCTAAASRACRTSPAGSSRTRYVAAGGGEGEGGFCALAQRGGAEGRRRGEGGGGGEGEEGEGRGREGFKTLKMQLWTGRLVGAGQKQGRGGEKTIPEKSGTPEQHVASLFRPGNRHHRTFARLTHWSCRTVYPSCAPLPPASCSRRSRASVWECACRAAARPPRRRSGCTPSPPRPTPPAGTRPTWTPRSLRCVWGGAVGWWGAGAGGWGGYSHG